MELLETISESFATLAVNKLRTALAILGIVIGIGSVIALLSLGQATQRSVETQIQSLGVNLLTVNPGAVTQGNVRGAAGGGTTLTNEDADAIATSDQITTIKTVSPEVQTRTQVTAGRNNTNIQVVGATATYERVHNISMSEGSFITERDDASMAKVIVLGPTVVEDLFESGENPIGQTVRINGTVLRVIGITEEKGGTGFQNPDNMAYVPLNTAQKQLFGQKYLSSIALEAESEEVMIQAQNEVGYLLLDRHHLTDPSEADFTIFSQQSILDIASETTGMFTTLLSGIAAISLIVGGIGIMNIMLVTVTERTREIGLRKALGAQKKTIIMQFLTESIILTFTGGLLGILLGIALSFGYSVFTSSLFIISPSSVLLAFAVSAGIGVLFGWYPASRAANMQPIEALRYE